VFLLSLCHAAGVPEEMSAALAGFRTEGPFGWAFTQSSSDGKESLVETYDPSQAEPFRWTLVSRNGAPATQDDCKQYQQNKLIRTSALDAPRLERQLDLDSCLQHSVSERLLKCTFRLKPGEQHDDAHANLSVLVTVDRPSRTITEVEISSIEPFSPVFGVRIASSRTLLNYSLPEDGRPSLLLRAQIVVEGRAFWFKSLNQRLEITWSQHRFAGHGRKQGS
jgi:hypothetical protein